MDQTRARGEGGHSGSESEADPVGEVLVVPWPLAHETVVVDALLLQSSCRGPAGNGFSSVVVLTDPASIVRVDRPVGFVVCPADDAAPWRPPLLRVGTCAPTDGAPCAPEFMPLLTELAPCPRCARLGQGDAAYVHGPPERSEDGTAAPLTQRAAFYPVPAVSSRFMAQAAVFGGLGVEAVGDGDHRVYLVGHVGTSEFRAKRCAKRTRTAMHPYARSQTGAPDQVRQHEKEAGAGRACCWVGALGRAVWRASGGRRVLFAGPTAQATLAHARSQKAGAPP